MNKRILDLLYRSFDAELSENEATELDSALASSEILRDEKEKTLAMREMIHGEALRSFKPFFATRVMSRLISLDTERVPMDEFFHSLWASFRPVVVAGGLALAALLSINFANSDGWNLDAALGVAEPSLEEAWQLNVLPESD